MTKRSTGEQSCHPGVQPAAAPGFPGEDDPPRVPAGPGVTSFSSLNDISPTRVDPEARNEEPKCAMSLAWLKDHVATMAELAKYTEPDEEVRSSNVWELVVQEQEKR